MRKRYIGEFKPQSFLIATAVFLAIGAFLFSKFEFRVEPSPNDQLLLQQQETQKLQERVNQLQATVDAVLSATQKPSGGKLPSNGTPKPNCTKKAETKP